MVLWWTFIVAVLVAIYWWTDRGEKDYQDYLRARRAEAEREAMQWFALLEERERESELQREELRLLLHRLTRETVNWKEEGF